MASVRRLFDLGADIETIDRHLSADSALAALVARRPGVRAPGGWDGFEISIRAVLGQQISVTAARQLASELVRSLGRVVPESFRPHPSLTGVFPTVKRLATASTIRLGMPLARLNTLWAMAEALVADPDLFCLRGSIDETLARMRSIRGIGEWTAQYIAMRAVREMDAFSATDKDLLRGAAFIVGMEMTPKNLLGRAETWRPLRAYAAQHLWAIGGI